MNRSSTLLVLALGALMATPALAQTPTAAQQQAIRSDCVSDFRANCSGVPTGGMDALVCLEQHVDSLSPACKSAVEAVEPATTAASATAAPATASSSASAPAETSAPAAAPATTAPAARPPEMTLRQEMRLAAGACAVDFRLFCPNLPVGHGNVLFCLRVHGPRLAPSCHEALVKAGVTF